MLHTGIGPTHVPSVGESTLKARERKVGLYIEKGASKEGEKNLWKDEWKGECSNRKVVWHGTAKMGENLQQPDMYTLNSTSERTENGTFGYAFPK